MFSTLRLKRVAPSALLKKSPKERELIRRQAIMDEAGFLILGATEFPDLIGENIAVPGHGLVDPESLKGVGGDRETIQSIMANAPQEAMRKDRMASCSDCALCETTERGAEPFSKCRALDRRPLAEFIDRPLAACPAGRWHAEYPMVEWPEPNVEAAIVIGSDDQAAWLAKLFILALRKLTGSKLPILCADFGLSAGHDLPVDGIFQVPGEKLHPMYRKAASAMFSRARWGIWYDTDIVVRVPPEEAIAELQASGMDLGVRRGERWWQIKHRGDNYHTGVFPFRHGSLAIQHWASWSLQGDDAWVTATDQYGIRDEELFAELMRTRRLPILDLDPRHARLPSEFNAVDFGMPPVDCARANWHFPGREAKQRFKAMAEHALAAV